jgi:hypothetical protein
MQTLLKAPYIQIYQFRSYHRQPSEILFLWRNQFEYNIQNPLPMQHFIRLYNNYSMLIILTLFHLMQSLSVSQALPSYTLSLGYPT